jgi:hypothetical protein
MLNIFPSSSILSIFIYLLLLIATAFSVFIVGYVIGRKDKGGYDKNSKRRSRSVLGGLFSEQVAPFLPDFPADLKASEARFIGKPIDFLIFKGMDEQNITEVVFVEVKSGTSQLSPSERKLKEAIDAKRVTWREYRIPVEVSNMQEKEEVISAPVTAGSSSI